MIYFTSDTHFWHKNIISYMNRPYGSVEDMNEGLIKLWNRRIDHDDVVYHLGDFAFCGTKKAMELFEQLNGTKVLIKGNHDGHSVTHLPWDDVRDYLCKHNWNYFDTEGNPQVFHQTIVLCHFPMQSWDRMSHNSWHLHGHCHGTLPDNGSLRIDVGIDTNGGYPYSLDDIIATMSLRKFVKTDHHG